MTVGNGADGNLKQPKGIRTAAASRRICEPVVEPVVAALTRAAPDDHARAIPDRGVTRARRGSAGRRYGSPGIGNGVILSSSSNWVSIRIRAAPDDELFTRPHDGGAEPRRRLIAPRDRPPDTGPRVVDLPIRQRNEVRVDTAPDEEVDAVPRRSEEEPG